MGASHSNLTETNAVLNNELRSKCEEFVGKDESRLWNGVLHLLKNESISFSDAGKFFPFLFKKYEIMCHHRVIRLK